MARKIGIKVLWWRDSLFDTETEMSYANSRFSSPTEYLTYIPMCSVGFRIPDKTYYLLAMRLSGKNPILRYGGTLSIDKKLEIAEPTNDLPAPIEYMEWDDPCYSEEWTAADEKPAELVEGQSIVGFLIREDAEGVILAQTAIFDSSGVSFRHSFFLPKQMIKCRTRL